MPPFFPTNASPLQSSGPKPIASTTGTMSGGILDNPGKKGIRPLPEAQADGHAFDREKAHRR